MKNQMTHHDSKLNEIISLTSTAPGVYLMKDADGKIIYVGKAVNLRARLRSYFHASAGLHPKTLRLVASLLGVTDRDSALARQKAARA